MNDQDLDKLFKAQLEDTEVSPPDYIWEQIEAELPQKKKPLLMPLISIAAACICIGFGLFFILKNEKPSPLHKPSLAATPPKEPIAEPAISEEQASPKEGSEWSLAAELPPRKAQTKVYLSAVEQQPLNDADSREEELSEDREAVYLAQNKLYVSQINSISIADHIDIPNIEDIQLATAEATVQLEDRQSSSSLNAGRILNFLIGKVDTYQQNIRFNTDEEGSLKLNISEAITKK